MSIRVQSLLCVILFAAPVLAQSTACDQINAAKKKTYGFNPTKLTDAGRKAQSSKMDAFWKLAEAKGAHGADCLKQLLAAEKEDGFFLFDGASLLYSLDPGQAAAVVDAVLRADITQVDPAGYLRFSLQLSQRGVDIGPIAIKYLHQPNPQAVVPMHAMTFDRNLAAVVLFGSMRSELVDRYASSALSDPDANLRPVAALALGINMTEKSFATLKSYSLEQLPPDIKRAVLAYRTYTPLKFVGETPKFSREQVLKVIRRIPHTEAEYKAVAEEEMKYRERREKSEPRIAPGDTKALAAKVRRDVEEGEPFIGIAGATAFLKSAALTLQEDDLAEVREARRKSVQSLSDETLYEYFAYTQIIEDVINRLDLYKDYRLHQ